ncbi:hypothetical protein WJX73_005029 [Symbiochloris irregularis]|uniref:Isobutyryl-CoA dehydrogenase, mitochondrial n=1 Tax=Symbiochloris irregularis TaxID=706552 RepID=A0AAW1NVR9_9CHLO
MNALSRGVRRLACSLSTVPEAWRSSTCFTQDRLFVSTGIGSDAGLSEAQRLFKDAADEFASKELAPHSAQWDEQHHFPVATVKAAASLGFASLYIAEDYGGAGLDRQDAAVIFESLAYGDVPVTAYLTIHNMVSAAIERYGSEEQKRALLPQLTSMERLASYCLTEPGSGSDAASLQTTARRSGDHYLISGSKAFISGGGVSDLYLVLARTGAAGPSGISAFIVDKDTEGLSFGKPERKMGWNAQPTTSVTFDDVTVPAEAMLGPEGGGFKIAMNALNGGRINIGACSVGGASMCLDFARDYVAGRSQFGRPIASFQATKFKLADMATQIHASRLMVRRAAQALDEGDPSATVEAAMAKRFATDACYGICNDALQMLGGYGYLKDYPIERVVRDLRVHSILEGTNEIMRTIISKEIDKLGVS